MSIPKMNSDDLRRFIREGVINAMVDKANERFQDVIDPHNGYKSVVDTRRFSYTVADSAEWLTFPIELDADEYPVRAAIRSFDTALNKGTYVPSFQLKFDRAKQELSIHIDRYKKGEVYVEFWKQIKF